MAYGRAEGGDRISCADVVVVSGEIGTLNASWAIGIWARLSRRRVYFWTSAWESPTTSPLALRIKRLALRLYLRLPHKSLVYSTKAKKDMTELGVAAERIVVCYNGLEVEDVLRRRSDIDAAAAKLRSAQAIGDRTLFLYVGRAIQGKGLDLLIAAFRESGVCEDSVLWVVGDGPSLANLKAETAAAQSANIKFWGRIYDDVDNYFAAADCFCVLPGLGGLALNQAMILGVPAICSVADELSEEDLVVDRVTGLRSQSRDVASLGRAMQEAMDLHKAGKLELMGNAARERVLEASLVDRNGQHVSGGRAVRPILRKTRASYELGSAGCRRHRRASAGIRTETLPTRKADGSPVRATPAFGFQRVSSTRSRSATLRVSGPTSASTRDINETYGCGVWAFDPTPKVVEWIPSKELPAKFS